MSVSTDLMADFYQHARVPTLHHLAHAGCCVIFLLSYELRRDASQVNPLDDRNHLSRNWLEGDV